MPIYIEEPGVDVVEVGSLNPGYEQNTVFICDKFDIMLEQQAVNFGSHNGKRSIFGLSHVYHSKKSYFLSATYDSYIMKLLN